MSKRWLKAGLDVQQEDGKKEISMADFTLGPVLGTGSFGRVSLAKHNITGVMCAVKALSKAHVVKNQQVSS